MLRKTFIALLAVVSIGLSPTVASARGGFGGFGGHGFGGHGGFHGGLGLGLAGAYGGWGYPYYASYCYGGCYLVRQRIWTPYGWVLRPVQVCDY